MLRKYKIAYKATNCRIKLKLFVKQEIDFGISFPDLMTRNKVCRVRIKSVRLPLKMAN
jgi:hypothetical protein